MARARQEVLAAPGGRAEARRKGPRTRWGRGVGSVRIATSQGIVEIPWESSEELRRRLLAADLDSLEDEFAAKGTSASIVIDLADKEPLLELVLAWIEDVGEKQAVALGGLLALRDALRADFAGPPDPPVGDERAWS